MHCTFRAFNIDLGPEKEQIMMTGLHKIRPVKCKQCRDTIGWKYVFAYEESEKYKEGKCIIERAYLAKNRSNSNNSISDDDLKEQQDDQEEESMAT